MAGTAVNRNRRYGVSSRYGFGGWSHTVYGPFETEEQAQEWLHTEEDDFRERELMSKTAAAGLAGRKAVENAVDWQERKQAMEEAALS